MKKTKKTKKKIMLDPAARRLIEALESCAKSVKVKLSVPFDPHEAYEEQMASRDRKRERIAREVNKLR